MERYHLLYFFNDLIQLSIKYPGDPGFGIGCSHLLESMMLRQEAFINQILEDDDHGRMFHEYRLNGAGLKMHWRLERKNVNLTNSPDDNCGPVHITKFKCYISGDQVQQYADFYVQAKELIRKRGYNHR